MSIKIYKTILLITFCYYLQLKITKYWAETFLDLNWSFIAIVRIPIKIPIKICQEKMKWDKKNHYPKTHSAIRCLSGAAIANLMVIHWLKWNCDSLQKIWTVMNQFFNNCLQLSSLNNKSEVHLQDKFFDCCSLGTERSRLQTLFAPKASIWTCSFHL